MLAAVVLSATMAMATVSTCGSLTAGDNTVGYYVANNVVCDVGNLQFSSFAYVGSANPTGDAIPGTSIQVTAVSGGIDFSAGWSVSTQSGNVSSFEDSDVSFTVTGINGYKIEDIGLAFNGSYTGNGTSSVTEEYCLGTTVPVSICSNPSTPITVTNPPPVNPSDVTFTPVTSLTVSKDIDVTSGTKQMGSVSTATISDVTNTFSVVNSPSVPEPATFGMLGLGMLALGLLRRSTKN
jgi:hypothetical protein